MALAIEQESPAMERFISAIPNGIARRVIPLLYYGIASAIERRGIHYTRIAFERVAEVSEVDARARGSNDFWHSPESVRQAFYKIRAAFRRNNIPFPSFDMGSYRVELSLGKWPGADALDIGVFFVRKLEGGQEEHFVPSKAEIVNYMTVAEFTRDSAIYAAAFTDLRVVGEAHAALGAMLLHHPITIIAGQSYRLTSSPAHITAIDWGDGTGKHPVSQSRGITHVFRKAGTFSVTVYGERRVLQRFPDMIRVVEKAVPSDIWGTWGPFFELLGPSRITGARKKQKRPRK